MLMLIAASALVFGVTSSQAYYASGILNEFHDWIWDGLWRKSERCRFSRKREAWAYEREWRLVDSDNRFSEQPHVTLEPNTITQVIFGGRTLQDDREWVFEWLRLSKCRASTQRVRFSGVRARLHVEKFTERDKW